MQKRLDLYINGQIVDQYKDESVNILEVIKDITDPAKLFTEYSRTFDLPASKNNNKIFKHYHRHYITNGLDARAFIPAKLTLNGVDYKLGNIELLKVELYNNQPSSYEVSFVGNTTELVKRLKSDELADLDLSAENHNNAENDIYNRFRVGTGNSNVKYPLISKEKRFIWNPADQSAADGLDDTKNIAYVNNTRNEESYGVNQHDLIPALRLEPIFDAIETKYGITFANDSAFKQDYIKDLHILLYRKQVEQLEEPVQISDVFDNPVNPTLGMFNGVELNSNGELIFSDTGLSGSFNQFHVLDIEITASNSSTYTVDIMEDDSVFSTSGEVTGTYTDSISGVFVTGRTYTIKVTGDVGVSFTLTADLEEVPAGAQGGTVHTYTDSISLTDTSGQLVISQHIPNIKVIDFLTGLFKMFNLVATIDKDNVVTVDTYTRFMSRYVDRDITEYIVGTNSSIEKTNPFNEIEFKFQSPKTRLTKAFSEYTGREYGSQEYAPTVSNNRITGDNYKVQLPFQMVVSEAMANLDYPNSGALTAGVNYVNTVNESGKKTDIAPYLFYCFGQTGRNVAYDRSSGVNQVNNLFLISNVYKEYDTTNSTWLYKANLSFQDEIHVWDSINIIDKNLFNMFYYEFISQAFESSSRRLKIAAKLPDGLLHDLKLSDILTINDNKYRINSIDTNYLTGLSNLDLITLTATDIDNYTVKTVRVCATGDSKVGFLNEGGEPDTLFIADGTCLTFTLIGDLKSVEGSVTVQELVSGGVWNLNSSKWNEANQLWDI